MARSKQFGYYTEAEEYYSEPEEVKPIFLCSDCEEGIYEGDRSWCIGGRIYCEDCAKESFSQLA